MAGRHPRPAAPDPVALAAFADGLLESCARAGLPLRATLGRYLPAVGERLGACAAALRTCNEELAEEVFTWSADGGPVSPPPRALAVRRGHAALRGNGLVWLAQPLDVAGARVGGAAFAFDARGAGKRTLAPCVDAVCEELDGVLWSIQGGLRKQQLIERLTRALSRRVFRRGLDEAVAALHEELRFERLAVLHRDDSAPEGSHLDHRVWWRGRAVHDSHGKPHPTLRAAVEAAGDALLAEPAGQLAGALGWEGAIEIPLEVGVAAADRLGTVAILAPAGLDTMGRDLVRVFSYVVSQRLVDYNRERRHLAQFFPARVIDELLRDPAYASKYLRPRVEDIAVLFADINSFTKICELGLKTPERVARFVDRWSEGAVRIVWEHGGVFDKMVGDCVIAHFGPPFFRDPAGRRAGQALRAAARIQAFTAALESDPAWADLAPASGVPGLGVAVGINLCPVSVGAFGPNHDYTAFGSGMNNAARLQSHAAFREVLAMESVRKAIAGTAAEAEFAFEGPVEAHVKNVARPLRFFRVRPKAAASR